MRSRRAFALTWSVVAALGGGLLAGAIAGSAWWGAGVALAVAGGAWWLSGRSGRSRRSLDRTPFPEPWRRVLEEQVAYYVHLSSEERRRFEREVRYFLVEQTITGPRGEAIDDEARVLVAASAVMLVFGHEGFRWPRLRDIVVYPDAYDDEYRVRHDGHVLGEVGHQGPVVLSSRALRQGFDRSADGHHLGLHELAHVLDLQDGEADGIPSLMPWANMQPWIDVMRRETLRVQEGRSLLRQYAATNEAEFFAVATEAFFERPWALRKRHPELYALLAETYGQDPACAEPSPS